MDRISANEVARSREDREEGAQEAVLSTEWTTLDSDALHWTSPEPLLETERRRVEVEEDEEEWGRTSMVRAGMS